jgi:formyl-CoA transferase
MICQKMHSFKAHRNEDTDADSGPLAGIKVLAVEHSVAGPLATRIFGELGADVIKIERPDSGDFARHWDGNVAGEGAQFWWLNRFKQSVELDMKSEQGAQTLLALLAEADVLLHNLAPPSATRLGLDGAMIEARFPRLVNCQISGYGADGPATDRKAYDMLVQAEAGVMSLTGTPEQPMRVGVSISDVSSGLYAALLVLAALLERDRTGLGRHLDVAMLGPMLTSYLNSGAIYPRIPDHHHAIAPYGVFTCADGDRVLIAVEQDGEWHRLCEEVFGDPELSADERYLSNHDRLERRVELRDLLAPKFAALPSKAVIAALSDAGLAYAEVNDIAGVAVHDVVAHRGLIVQGETVGGEAIKHLRGTPERLFSRPAPARDRPPSLGEDTEAVLGTLEPAPSNQSREGERE